MDVKPNVDCICKTGNLLDLSFNDTKSNNGDDFSMSDILHFDSANCTMTLIENRRGSTESDSNLTNTNHNFKISDSDIMDLFSDDDIRNETFNFDLPDILEESPSRETPEYMPLRTQIVSENNQDQWNVEISKEANKISRRLSLSISSSEGGRLNSASTYIICSSGKSSQDLGDDEFSFDDSPVTYSLTPSKGVRKSSSDKENDPFRANRLPQHKTPRSTKKNISPESVSSNDSVFSDKIVQDEEVNTVNTNNMNITIPILLTEVNETENAADVTQLINYVQNETKPIRKKTYNLDTDEESFLVSANIDIPHIEPLHIRRETYSLDSDDMEHIGLKKPTKTRHSSGPSNLTPSSVKEEEEKPSFQPPLNKSKSLVGLPKPKTKTTFNSKPTTVLPTKLAQPSSSSFLRKPAIPPPQTKSSLQPVRSSGYGTRPKIVPPTGGHASRSSFVKPGPVKAQQKFPALNKVETGSRTTKPKPGLQAPNMNVTTISSPVSVNNRRPRAVTPQGSPVVTANTPNRRLSLLPTPGRQVPLTPGRLSMIPNTSGIASNTPGRRSLATSSPRTPSLTRSQTLNLPYGYKGGITRLPSPMSRK